MKKQKTFSIVIVSIIAVIFAIGLSYVSAAWTNPSGTPPSANLAAPVNASVVDQVKEEGLSVGTFVANQDSHFFQRVHFRGLLNGGTPGASNATLHIGGVSTDTDTNTYRVAADIRGSVKSQGTLGATELINSSLNSLCADYAGHVILCTPPAADNVITGTLGGAGHSVRISLDKPSPQSVTIPTYAKFDINGTEQRVAMDVQISAGETSGSTSYGAVYPYVCSVPTYAPSRYEYHIGVLTYLLVVTDPCL
jgi:hypothetical protein